MAIVHYVLRSFLLFDFELFLASAFDIRTVPAFVLCHESSLLYIRALSFNHIISGGEKTDLFWVAHKRYAKRRRHSVTTSQCLGSHRLPLPCMRWQGKILFSKIKNPWIQPRIITMGRTMGLEPTTSGSTDQRSNRLSYVRHSIT